MGIEEVLERMRLEEKLPIKEQHPWSNSIYFEPNTAQMIYMDSPISSEEVFNMVKCKRLIYIGVNKHQGEGMPCYRLL
jgi:hypothetical protein